MLVALLVCTTTEPLMICEGIPPMGWTRWQLESKVSSAPPMLIPIGFPVALENEYVPVGGTSTPVGSWNVK